MIEIIGGAVIAGVGVAKLLSTLREWRSAISSRSWPRVEGVVTDSKVLAYRVRMSGEGWGSQIYRPVIRYRYVVDGQEYRSERIYHGRALGRPWRGPLEELVHRFPEGRIMGVYLPPGDPKGGLLVPGPKIDLYASTAVFTVILAVGVSLMLGVWT